MTFKYYEQLPSFDITEVLCARIGPDIKTRSELLHYLYDLLCFPGYFGFNWNALYDCLCDFQWVDNQKIVLIHQNIPELPAEEVTIYIDILSDAISSWEGEKMRDFDVFFRLEDKHRIEEILKLTK